MNFEAQSDGRVDFSDFFAGNGQAEEVGANAAVFFFPGNAEEAEGAHFIEDSAVEDFLFVAFFYGRSQAFCSKIFGEIGNVLLHFCEFKIHE